MAQEVKRQGLQMELELVLVLQVVELVLGLAVGEGFEAVELESGNRACRQKWVWILAFSRDLWMSVITWILEVIVAVWMRLFGSRVVCTDDLEVVHLGPNLMTLSIHALGFPVPGLQELVAVLVAVKEGLNRVRRWSWIVLDLVDDLLCLKPALGLVVALMRLMMALCNLSMLSSLAQLCL